MSKAIHISTQGKEAKVVLKTVPKEIREVYGHLFFPPIPFEITLLPFTFKYINKGFKLPLLSPSIFLFLSSSIVFSKSKTTRWFFLIYYITFLFLFTILCVWLHRFYHTDFKSHAPCTVTCNIEINRINRFFHPKQV